MFWCKKLRKQRDNLCFGAKSLEHHRKANVFAQKACNNACNSKACKGNDCNSKACKIKACKKQSLQKQRLQNQRLQKQSFPQQQSSQNTVWGSRSGVMVFLKVFNHSHQKHWFSLRFLRFLFKNIKNLKENQYFAPKN